MGNLGSKLIKIGQYCDCLQPIFNQIQSEPQIQIKDLSEIQIQASKIDHDFQKELQLQHRQQKRKAKKRKILSKQQIQNKLIISQKINNDKTQDSLLLDQINFSIQKNQDQLSVKKYCKSKIDRSNKKRKVIFQQDQKTQTYSQNLNDFLKDNEQQVDEQQVVSMQLEQQKNRDKNPNFNKGIVQDSIIHQNIQQESKQNLFQRKKPDLHLIPNKNRIKDSFFNQNNSQKYEQKVIQKKKLNHAIPNQHKIKYSILEQLNNGQKKKKKQKQKLIIKKRKPSTDSSQFQQELYQRNRNGKQVEDLSLEQVIDLQKLPPIRNIPHKHKNPHFKQLKIDNKSEQLQNNSIDLKIQKINKKKQSISDSFSLKDYFLDDLDKHQFDAKHEKQQMFN